MQVVNSDEIDSSIIDYAGHMQRAIALADRVLTASPNPRVGCVLVNRENKIISEGWHIAAGQAHAEVMALATGAPLPDSVTAFVSLEPCSHHGRTPPCSEALITAGVKTVVIAGLDPYPEVAGQGVAKLEAAGIDVVHLHDFARKAESLNPGYMKRHRHGLPFLRCKLAMSLDGRTAMANGESKWITGTLARADVQRLRAASCAIVTGVETVLADDPGLNVRIDELAELRQPMRVIIDSKLRTPSQAKILKTPGEVKIYTTGAAADSANNHRENVEILSILEVDNGAEHSEQRVNLKTMLESLADRYSCNEVLLEAGPTLAGAFLQAGLIDELIIYIGARLLGSDAKPLLYLPGLSSMSDQVQLKINDIARFDEDIRITATMVRQGND